MKHRDLEGPVQRAILETIWAGYPSVWVHSVPNGGFILEPRTVAKLKYLGLMPGTPDLVANWPIGNTGYLEIKSEGGRLSPDQVAVHNLLRSIGIRVEVCRSVEDLHEVFAKWDIPSRIQGRAA